MADCTCTTTITKHRQVMHQAPGRQARAGGTAAPPGGKAQKAGRMQAQAIIKAQTSEAPSHRCKGGHVIGGAANSQPKRTAEVMHPWFIIIMSQFWQLHSTAPSESSRGMASAVAKSAAWSATASSSSSSTMRFQQRTDHPCRAASSTPKWNGTSSTSKCGIINCKSSMGGEL